MRFSRIRLSLHPVIKFQVACPRLNAFRRARPGYQPLLHESGDGHGLLRFMPPLLILVRVELYPLLESSRLPPLLGFDSRIF